MPEPHGEESRGEDLSPEEQEELEAFGKALKRLDQQREVSPDFHKRLTEEISKRWPEDQSAIERLQREREQRDSEHEGRG
jgi:hypothetical protein